MVLLVIGLTSTFDIFVLLYYFLVLDLDICWPLRAFSSVSTIPWNTKQGSMQFGVRWYRCKLQVPTPKFPISVGTGTPV